MSEELTVAAVLAGVWVLEWVIDRALKSYLEVLRLRLKQAQLQDRIFRDACDTIHHLRVENDALTSMLMAAQGRSK